MHALAGVSGAGPRQRAAQAIHSAKRASHRRTTMVRELPDLPPTAGLSQTQRLLKGRQRLIRVAQLDI